MLLHNSKPSLLQLYLSVEIPPMRAITYLKTVSTIVFFLVVAVPDLVSWFYKRAFSPMGDERDPLLDGGRAPPICAGWVCVLAAALFRGYNPLGHLILKM